MINAVAEGLPVTMLEGLGRVDLMTTPLHPTQQHNTTIPIMKCKGTVLVQVDTYENFLSIIFLYNIER